MRLARRIARAEAVAAVRFDDNTHAGLARWNARFLRADPRHRAVMDEIHRRMALHTPGFYSGPPKPQVHAGHCFLSMDSQLNLMNQEDYLYDPTKRVADWPEARRVFDEFVGLLASYQLGARDVFPGRGYGIEALVDGEVRRAWGPTPWEIASAFPAERRAGAALAPDFIMGLASPENQRRFADWAAARPGGTVVSLNPARDSPRFTRHAAACDRDRHPVPLYQSEKICVLCCDDESQVAEGLRRLGLIPGGLNDCPKCRGVGAG